MNPSAIYSKIALHSCLQTAFTICALVLMCSCSVNTNSGYGDYIEYSSMSTPLQRRLPAACYYLPYTTQNHYYSFKSFMGGYYTTDWEVELGKMIDATLQHGDVYNSFALFKKVDGQKCVDGPVITVEVNSYTFTSCQAHAVIKFTVRQGDRKIMENNYAAIGNKQCGKMYWGGSLLMKNAVQQSTKDTLEKILTLFVADFSAATSKNAIN